VGGGGGAHTDAAQHSPWRRTAAVLLETCSTWLNPDALLLLRSARGAHLTSTKSFKRTTRLQAV